jgi:hypothetical protein
VQRLIQLSYQAVKGGKRAVGHGMSIKLKA